MPEATIFGDPDVPKTQETWLQMIQSARQRIDIAAFYIADKPGGLLSPVLDALIARAKTGVKVRILIDQTFLKNKQDNMPTLRDVPNIEIRVLPVDTLTGDRISID